MVPVWVATPIACFSRDGRARGTPAIRYPCAAMVLSLLASSATKAAPRRQHRAAKAASLPRAPVAVLQPAEHALTTLAAAMECWRSPKPATTAIPQVGMAAVRLAAWKPAGSAGCLADPVCRCVAILVLSPVNNATMAIRSAAMAVRPPARWNLGGAVQALPPPAPMPSAATASWRRVRDVMTAIRYPLTAVRQLARPTHFAAQLMLRGSRLAPSVRASRCVVMASCCGRHSGRPRRNL